MIISKLKEKTKDIFFMTATPRKLVIYSFFVLLSSLFLLTILIELIIIQKDSTNRFIDQKIEEPAFNQNLNGYSYQDQNTNYKGYNLPLEKLPYNYDELTNKLAIDLSYKQKVALIRDGVTRTDNVKLSFGEAYKLVDDNNLPIFISSDSIIEFYNIKIKGIIDDVKQNKLNDNMESLFSILLIQSVEKYRTVTETNFKDINKANSIYLGVAIKLLNEDYVLPSSFDQETEKIVEKIKSCNKVSIESPECSSFLGPQVNLDNKYQGVDRNYIRTFLWLNNNEYIMDKNLWVRQMIVLTGILKERALIDNWHDVYSVINYIYGIQLEPNFYNYNNAVIKAFGKDFFYDKEFSDDEIKMIIPILETDNSGEIVYKVGNNQFLNMFEFIGPNLSSTDYNSILIFGKEQGLLTQDIGFYKDCASLNTDLYKYTEEVCKSAVEYYCQDNCVDSVAESVLSKVGEICVTQISSSFLYTDLNGLNKDLSGFCLSSKQSLEDINNISEVNDWTFDALLTKSSLEWQNTSTWKNAKEVTSIGSNFKFSKIEGNSRNDQNVRDQDVFLEPASELYFRMGFVSSALMSGLKNYNMLTNDEEKDLKDLGSELSAIFNISNKVSNGTVMDDKDMDSLYKLVTMMEVYAGTEYDDLTLQQIEDKDIQSTNEKFKFVFGKKVSVKYDGVNMLLIAQQDTKGEIVVAVSVGFDFGEKVEDIDPSAVDENNFQKPAIFNLDVEDNNFNDKDLDGYDFAFQNPGSVRIPVLMYHQIATQPSSYRHLYVTPEIFEQQLAYLAANNYKTITPYEFYQFISSGKNPSQKTIMLTFDDGNTNHYTTAYPLLKKYGMIGVFYVPSSKSGISASQMKEMSQNGMLIDSHSATHPDLTKVTDIATLNYEIGGSKYALQSITGQTVFSFSYPGCAANDTVVQLTSGAGFLLGLSCGKSIDHYFGGRYGLSRMHVYNNMDNFKKILAGYWEVPANY